MAGVAVTVLALAELGSHAQAQTFNETLQGALDNQCQGLRGPKTGNLETICKPLPGPGPVSGASSSGSSIASQTMRQQDMDQRRIQLRLEEQREGRAEGGVRAASADPGSQSGKLGLFATAEGEWVDKDVTRFEPGFSSSSVGGIVGADYRVLPWLTTGLAFSYLNTDGHFFQASGGHFSTDTFGFTLYAGATPLPNLFVDGTVGYTLREYEIVRRAIFSAPGVGVNGLTRGNTTGNEFRTSVQVGYDFPLRALTVGPRFGVNYSNNDINSFNETGVTGLELVYNGQHRESVTTTLGAFLSYAISTSIGVFVPQVTSEWVHEFLDNQRVIYFHFRQDVGQTKLRFQTDAPDRDYFNLGGGVVLVLPKAVSVFLNYRAMVGYSNRETQTVTGGIRVNF